MATDPSAERFRRYWTRLDLREKAYDVPAPCISWRRVPGLNEVEALVWATVRGASTLLDYGSGDQSLRRKLLEAGYQGRYETFDLSDEFPTTHRQAEDIRGPFDAVLCLEVIEHLPLEAGMALRDRLVDLLAPGGVLVLSTPNPACVVSPFASDETHLHLYPLRDLVAWARGRGLAVEARRVQVLPPRVSVGLRMRLLARRVLCAILGADRADGLLLICRRPPAGTQARDAADLGRRGESANS